jgi:hypothetical protein
MGTRLHRIPRAAERAGHQTGASGHGRGAARLVRRFGPDHRFRGWRPYAALLLGPHDRPVTSLHSGRQEGVQVRIGPPAAYRLAGTAAGGRPVGLAAVLGRRGQRLLGGPPGCGSAAGVSVPPGSRPRTSMSMSPGRNSGSRTARSTRSTCTAAATASAASTTGRSFRAANGPPQPERDELDHLFSAAVGERWRGQGVARESMTSGKSAGRRTRYPARSPSPPGYSRDRVPDATDRAGGQPWLTPRGRSRLPAAGPILRYRWLAAPSQRRPRPPGSGPSACARPRSRVIAELLGHALGTATAAECANGAGDGLPYLRGSRFVGGLQG